MQRLYSNLLAFILIANFTSCSSNNSSANKTDNDTSAAKVARIDGHPSWIMLGNIYEVNVRQYTAAGTFNAFAENLDRLKKMGVQTLWFMPINPISKVDRKGVLGSYYAVADYTQVNPEFGTIDDWKNLVKRAHDLGFKVVLDWVPNHSGADNRWLTQHPDFYVKDSTGKAAVPYDWTDTRKLDYSNKALRDSMIDCMKYWITASDIDGFRCDVAGDVPDDFWKQCIPELKKIKPDLFMLGEADKPSLHNDGFDATYAWQMFAMMKKIAKGERNALALDSVRNYVDTAFPANALKMYFTSDHDENSWNKADYATMPGASHAPFAVLTQTMPNDVPLIYSGQEEPVLDSISFFYKDAIQFKNFKREKFYTTLLALRANNPALAANESFKKIIAGDEKAVYAYVRQAGSDRVLVILNLSSHPQEIKIEESSLLGNAHNVFMGTDEKLTTTKWSMEPWGYAVYTYQ